MAAHKLHQVQGPGPDVAFGAIVPGHEPQYHAAPGRELGLHRMAMAQPAASMLQLGGQDSGFRVQGSEGEG